MNDPCPYCGAEVALEDSAMIYGQSYGMVYVCTRYPECDAYVGCHKGTIQALGRLANRELRQWKQNAHACFDPLWKSERLSRSDAYAWLSRQMGTPPEETHIGMFDVDQCK